MTMTSVNPVFFFQAEDGIRDKLVTGVQTCALPILISSVLQAEPPPLQTDPALQKIVRRCLRRNPLDRFRSVAELRVALERSEERRVGKECRSGWSPYHEQNDGGEQRAGTKPGG